MPALKVWNLSRTRKFCIPYKPESELTVEFAIEAGSLKHQYDGHSLVLLDGTIIDDSECLIAFKDEVLLLLTADEASGLQNDNSGYETLSPSTEPRVLSDSSINPKESKDHDEQVDGIPLANLPVNNLTRPENSNHKKARHTSAQVVRNDNNSRHSTDANSINQPKNSSPPKTFKNFKVPFNKFRSDVVFEMNRYEDQSIEMGENPKKRVRTAVSQRVMGEMRMIGHNAKKPDFEKVALDLRDKWLSVFKDLTEDGESGGEGVASYIRTLANRNWYCNRLERSKNGTKERIPINMARGVMSLQAGCPNWQPKNEPTEEEVESARTYLFGYRPFNLKDDNIAESVTEAFTRSFPDRREYLTNLNSSPTVQDILQVWPCILKNAYFYRHYDLLTNVSSDRISQSFIDKRIKIFVYAVQNSLIETNADISSQGRSYLAMSLIFQKFNEQMDRVFIPLTVSNNLQGEWPFDYPSVRVMIAVGDGQDNVHEPQTYKKEYSPIIDKKKIFSTFYFEEVLAGLLCSYFVLNRIYPEPCSATFEFVQMYFVNVYYSDGCRGKLGKQKEKALTLNNALKKINVAEFFSRQEINSLDSNLINRLISFQLLLPITVTL
ncbi:hypothetical protein QAD02_004926 [Eretmocerus hayati]|uniref:Uncharacterized protein n=1 Tax=Eretmocerus hayati TaxID=131215 RepID=A0ACC2NRD8_9HYME|nr:hypothetical protein QAD02_004926 [Eretmocerus hayati]